MQYDNTSKTDYSTEKRGADGRDKQTDRQEEQGWRETGITREKRREYSWESWKKRKDQRQRERGLTLPDVTVVGAQFSSEDTNNVDQEHEIDLETEKKRFHIISFPDAISSMTTIVLLWS